MKANIYDVVALAMLKAQQKPQRTLTQNNAMHSWFTMMSDKLNESGYGVKIVFEHHGELEFTPALVKEVWRRIQKKQLGKISTAQLTSDEITKIYEEANRYFSESPAHVGIPFPSQENKIDYDSN